MLRADADIEAGLEDPDQRVELSDESDDGGETCFSDAEDRSLHSWNDLNCAGSSYEEYFSAPLSVSGMPAAACAGGPSPEQGQKSCVAEVSLDIDVDIDLEGKPARAGNGELEEEMEGNCRICQLGLESAALESGEPIVLGCLCKGDLAATHKQCAETWFKIRGNKICEICGSAAENVMGSGEPELMEHSNEANSSPSQGQAASAPLRFWQGRRFLNFLLACMVFAFVISWLFHFNIPG